MEKGVARTARRPRQLDVQGFPKLAKPLARKLDRKRFGASTTTIRYRDKQGRVRFKGTAGLKETQTYPSSFGRNAPRLYCKMPDCIAYSFPSCPPCGCL